MAPLKVQPIPEVKGKLGGFKKRMGLGGDKEGDKGGEITFITPNF
jgi:hypothetical protein